ncbi:MULTISPECIES: hypothetical protein [unclassified Streptomyces]|uniref:hypothetical protein n=1 Tax=unclassified Streptomyces TaxID=2593676 RepID=UPI00274141CA|nr:MULTISPECIES: hypothetical protein [unclassified Streptomyces]
MDQRLRGAVLARHDEPGQPCLPMADELEAAMIASAEEVLAEAKELLAESAVGEQELRFAGARLTESLRDTLRIAASRGGRLESEG